ncbi:P-loop containing nucleoside triphosphate hydrolase protein [Xylariaceae sp. FL0016]|nr:P-loop containing nucleoside triphosphate hydrolase protein [Xylariaceae sp. FL0016]
MPEPDSSRPDPATTSISVSSPQRPQLTPKFSDYLRVFSYATPWDFTVYVVAAIASLGAGVSFPLMNIIFGQLVGQFTDYYGSSSPSPDDFNALLNKQALYIMALFVARWGLGALTTFCFRMIGIRLSSAVRRQYLQALLAQSIHVIDSLPAGAPATAITTTSHTLQLGISEHLGTFLKTIATIVGAIAVAFVWSWELTLVASSLLLYLLAILAFCIPMILKRQSATVKADAEANAIANEAIGGIRLVMASGAQGRIMCRYERWVREAMVEAQKMAPVVGTQMGLVFFGIYGAFGRSFWYGSQRYIDGAISNAGVVVVVLMSVMLVLFSLQQVSTPLIAVTKAMVAACELFTIIDAPPPTSGSLKPDLANQDIVFDDVTFEYPSRPGTRVLDALRLRIQAGKNTALVGPSGSGKSTVVSLLERWYSLQGQHVLPKVVKAKPKEKSETGSEEEATENPEPTAVSQLSGSVMVGGYNVEDLDLQWWRSHIGLVQQEPFLFNDTVYNNVANGLIGTKWEDETEAHKRKLVQEACQEAYADDFVSQLPDGYDTRVGDGGAKLSGGQKQRIAIARSIVKQPQTIILDEATSAIDVKSEKVVQAALDKLASKHTTITIAHRLSTIKKADHIIVLQNGQAVEQGTHQSLVSNENGAYSALVRAQSLHILSIDAKEPEARVLDPDIRSGQGQDSNTQDSEPKVTNSITGELSKKPRSLIGSFGKLLYQQRTRWPSCLGIVGTSAAFASGTPVQAWLFAKVINTFLLSGEELKHASSFWGLMWLALAGAVGLSYFVEGWISLRVQYFVSAAYKMQYLADILTQRLQFFDEDQNSHGTLSFRTSSDPKQLEELLGLNLALLISGVFEAMGCVTIALAFSWKLGLIAAFITMPLMLVSGFWRYRQEMYFDKLNADVFMESSRFATEAIGAIRTVSSLMMESNINDRYKKLLNGHVNAARLKAQWTSVFFGFADSVSLGCQALVFWYGGKLLANGQYSLEAFFVCFMAIIQGAESSSRALAVAPSAAQAKAAANRILDIHESADAERRDTEKSQRVTGIEDGVKIELQNVYFKYPSRETPIFEGLNLTVEKNQYVALVGPSGCGKTTIISLLERFYELGSGRGSVLFNGINIQDLDVHDYRLQLSLVAQEPIMFRGTVRDNILFGIADPTAVSDERIQAVCREACIHDFIISLPEGYNTDVGQKGIMISGGQKQRVAIARALIRNPKVLLLDEATSALDSESERIVQDAFEKARRGRTMISVAHRLSTIRDADVIYVFDEGRVVEKGTHDELVEKKGTYWEMCRSQALDL